MPRDIVVQPLTEEAFGQFGRIIEGVFPCMLDDLAGLIASNAGQRVALPKTCTIDLDGLTRAIVVEIIEPCRDFRLTKMEYHLRGEEMVWCDSDCIAFAGPRVRNWQAPLEQYLGEMTALYVKRGTRLVYRPGALHYVPLIVGEQPSIVRFIKPLEIEESGTFTRKWGIPDEEQPRIVL